MDPEWEPWVDLGESQVEQGRFHALAAATAWQVALRVLAKVQLNVSWLPRLSLSWEQVHYNKRHESCGSQSQPILGTRDALNDHGFGPSSIWCQMNKTASLESVKAFARLMDSAVRVPGTKISVGLDALIGLIPIVGDLIGSVLGTYIVVVAKQLGVPRPVLARMSLNLAIDALLGVMPLIGDLFDVMWRANIRNVALLERALAAPQATYRSSIGVLVGLGLAALLLAVGGVALIVWVTSAVLHG